MNFYLFYWIKMFPLIHLKHYVPNTHYMLKDVRIRMQIISTKMQFIHQDV